MLRCCPLTQCDYFILFFWPRGLSSRDIHVYLYIYVYTYGPWWILVAPKISHYLYPTWKHYTLALCLSLFSLRRMLSWSELQFLCGNELCYSHPQILQSFKSGLRRWNLQSDKESRLGTGADEQGFFAVGKKGKKSRMWYEDLVREWLKGDPVGDWRNGRIVERTQGKSQNPASRNQTLGE